MNKTSEVTFTPKGLTKDVTMKKKKKKKKIGKDNELVQNSALYQSLVIRN